VNLYCIDEQEFDIYTKDNGSCLSAKGPKAKGCPLTPKGVYFLCLRTDVISNC